MREFESSGLRQSEFCRKHGIALSTLQRQIRKRRLKLGEAKSNRLLAVELAGKEREGTNRTRCALEVVLAGGGRIEVRRDFDSETLLRMIEVLEEI